MWSLGTGSLHGLMSVCDRILEQAQKCNMNMGGRLGSWAIGFEKHEEVLLPQSISLSVPLTVLEPDHLSYLWVKTLDAPI